MGKQMVERPGVMVHLRLERVNTQVDHGLFIPSRHLVNRSLDRPLPKLRDDREYSSIRKRIHTRALSSFSQESPTMVVPAILLGCVARAAAKHIGNFFTFGLAGDILVDAWDAYQRST